MNEFYSFYTVQNISTTRIYVDVNEEMLKKVYASYVPEF